MNESIYIDLGTAALVVPGGVAVARRAGHQWGDDEELFDQEPVVENDSIL